MLCVDTREGELIRLLTGAGAAVRPLPVGDIWIGIEMGDSAPHVQGGGLVIERKSIKDLEASILDGRYREQRGRILAFCQEQHAQPIYLLEGPWRSATGRLATSALIKFVNRLMFRYQIPVVRTESIEETAEWVQGAVEQWKDDPTALQRTTELVKVTDGMHVQKKANGADPRVFLIGCLAQCTGVSVKMAEAIVEVFPSMEQIMAASQAAIQEVKVGGRRVGPAVAARLYGLLHGGT